MKKTLYDTDVLLRSQMQDDPHKEIKVKLAEFLLALIQAFLRTGYYTPDHPESHKAKVGLYEDFQNLFVQKDELAFLVREDPGGKNILVEGVLPEIQDLNSLMIAGMAQMYVPRFVEYLEQKDLLSLTLKGTMSRTEFTNFVDLMGEPKFIDTQRKQDKERFSETLQDRGIFNISYIYNEELLAQERNIHWRSRIALTRLKKDFSIVPLYSTLGGKELKKVRRQIIHDVFRSFQNAEAIYSVLINTDLAVTKDFGESEIDQEIVDCLSDKVLLQVSQTLLNDSLRHGGAVPAQGKSLTLAMQLVSTLNQRQLKGREVILDEYAKLKLIPFDQLPKAKQLEIRQAKLTDKFLQNSTTFLTQLEKTQDRKKYHSIAQFLAIIVPELLHRDEYEKVLQIITHFERQSYKTDHRSTRARQILEKIGGVNILDILRARFLTGDQERCSAIAPVFLRLGLKSAPHLLSILKESKDFSIRKNVCEIFAQMDPAYIDHILKEVSKERLPAGHTIRIMRALGEVRRDEWVRPLNRALEIYLAHDNPRVREEALWVYYKINGKKGEAFYFGLLKDTDIGVQKKTIQCLGRIKSQPALRQLIEMLRETEHAPSEEQKAVAACIYRVLALYGNIEIAEIGTLENLLLATLERHLNRGSLRFIQKKKSILSDEAVASICETLGEIGTEKSHEILLKLKKKKDSPWGSKAEEAIRKISEGEAKEN